MHITIKRKDIGTPQPKAAPRSPHDRWRFGEWGRVEALHSDDITADVLLDSGVYLKRVPVASKEWVIIGEDAETKKDYNSGERDLPPVHASVYLIMPSATYNDCFITPFSGFSAIDQTAPYMDDEKEKIKERITPSGWHITDDHVTGSHKSVSPDEKTSLEIDYGNEEEPKEENPELRLNLFDNIKAEIVAEDNVSISVFDEVTIDHVKEDSCTIKVFDTEIVIKQGEVSIKPKETTIEVDGNAIIKTTGNTEIEAAGDVSVKGVNVDVEATANATVGAAQAQITGGTLQVNGTAAPGSGPFCALPACLFTGAAHTGNTVAGT